MQIFYKNPKVMKIISNIVIIILFIVFLSSAFMVVVGGGVLSDFDKTLIEVRKLEEAGLINNLPSTVSDHAKDEIESGMSSYDIEKYISETEVMLVYLCYSAIISAIMILMIVIFRILFKYKRVLYDFFSKK